jgi:hypothetical protein
MNDLFLNGHKVIKNPDAIKNQKFHTYRKAGGNKMVNRGTWGGMVASPATLKIKSFVEKAETPVDPSLSRQYRQRLRRRRRQGYAALTALNEATPSNLTVMRTDGTVVYQENHLPK